MVINVNDTNNDNRKFLEHIINHLNDLDDLDGSMSKNDIEKYRDHCLNQEKHISPPCPFCFIEKNEMYNLNSYIDDEYLSSVICHECRNVIEYPQQPRRY